MNLDGGYLSFVNDDVNSGLVKRKLFIFFVNHMDFALIFDKFKISQFKPLILSDFSFFNQIQGFVHFIDFVDKFMRGEPTESVNA